MKVSTVNENEELESKLLSEEKELSEQRKILSLDEFHPKALEFDKKVSIIRTEQGEKEVNLKNMARKEESEFYKRIYPLLAKEFVLPFLEVRTLHSPCVSRCTHLQIFFQALFESPVIWSFQSSSSLWHMGC